MVRFSNIELDDLDLDEETSQKLGVRGGGGTRSPTGKPSANDRKEMVSSLGGDGSSGRTMTTREVTDYIEAQRAEADRRPDTPQKQLTSFVRSLKRYYEDDPEALGDYASWVSNSINTGEILDMRDVLDEPFGMSSCRLTHTISGIVSKSSEKSTYSSNKSAAVKQLYGELEKNVSTWKDFLDQKQLGAGDVSSSVEEMVGVE